MTAKNLNDEGQYAEAEKRLRSVLATQRRVLGPQHLDTVKSMIAIAGVIYEQGRYQEPKKCSAICSTCNATCRPRPTAGGHDHETTWPPTECPEPLCRL